MQSALFSEDAGDGGAQRLVALRSANLQGFCAVFREDVGQGASEGLDRCKIERGHAGGEGDQAGLARQPEQVAIGGWAWRWLLAGEWRQRAGRFERRQRVLLGVQRRRGDERAPADLAAQIALLDQALVRARDRLRGDVQARRQTAYWRQSLARPEGARLHPPSQLVHQLLPERVASARGAIEGEGELNRLSGRHSDVIVR